MEDFDINRYKKKLKEAFSFFIKLCDEHNLRYFCAGGTALGAVRHHDFIPWDDDIDVLMPRRDYDKLLSMNAFMEKTNFNIISVSNCDQYVTFAKFYDKRTTLWELKEIPFVYGVYIDIFPLDETNDSVDVFMSNYMRLRNAQRLYQLSQMSYSIKDLFYYLRDKDKNLFIKGVLSLFIPRFLNGVFRKRILKLENSFKGQKGKFLVCPFGDYFQKEYFEKKWFDGFAEFPFGDLKVHLPKDYDAYLSHVFGDYMKLPPKDKQVSHHYHYYLDMDRALNIKQIKMLIEK